MQYATDQIQALTRFLVHRFFRHVEVSGLDHIPPEGGGILVSWHPNGLIDPGLIFSHFPRTVVFGARDGLFKVPVLGQLMRAVGTVPIFRAQDGGDLEERRRKNQQSLDAMSGCVAAGSFTCLFPEGDSHDAPYLLDLKTGAARFYYRARQLQPPGAPPPVIIPVGLHYDDKRSFRSSALIAFHPPMRLPAALDCTPGPEEGEEAAKARCRALTAEIEHTLREVVHATESWELHHLMHRVRKLVRAERAARVGAHPDAPDIAERTLAFARVWAGYYTRLATRPEEVRVLQSRVREYDADLRALGIEDHELDQGPAIVRPWLALMLGIQVALVFLVLPPLVLFGALVNLPAALLLWSASKLFRKRRKDEATIKLLLGTLAFPLLWLLAGYLAMRGSEELHAASVWIPANPLAAGIAIAATSALGGALAWHYARVARETLRAVRVRFTRARRRIALARLRVERGELCDGIEEMMGGLSLPGNVESDGRVVGARAPAPG